MQDAEMPLIGNPRLGCAAHPEGTRDRPGDSPATGRPIGHGANSDSVDRRSGTDDEGLIDDCGLLGRSRHRLSPGRVRQRHPPRLPRLRCPQPARPVLRVPGVLRSARGRVRVPDDHPRRDRSRSEVDLAVRAAAAGAGRHRHLPLHRSGLHPAGRRPPPGRRPRPEAAVGEGRLRQPHPLLQGPGRRRRAVRRPRARPAGAGLPVHRQPGQRRGRRGRPGRHQERRLRAREPRAAEDHRLRRLRHHPDRGARLATTT